MKKKLLVAVLSLTMLLTACGGKNTNTTSTDDANESDVIKLGGIIPKTGSAAVYGTTTENGILLAVEEINANGGIGGKQIEYTSEDDKADPTEAVNIYTKLTEQGVNGIIGSITSKPTQAVADNSTENFTPIITPTGTMASITEGKDNVFRTCFTDPLQGQILANFAADKLQAKKVAILRNTSDDYSNGVADTFKTQAESKGIEVVADEGYGDTDVDFKVQLTNIKNKAPDVILVPEYYEKDATIVTQAQELGIDATIIGPDGWDGVLAVAAEGSESSYDGIYFTNHYSVNDTAEKVQNFVKAYEEKYNEAPSAFAALGYDTVYIYKQAFESAKSLSNEDVVEAIKAVEIEGVTGSIKFGENNNPVKTATIIKISDGKYNFDSVVSPE
ncbi:branched-chain amino acid transport system substrate-binding protein [Anaerosphaera aminiphila DSM 21120]|uniref:Branched-chain amino acid transport system substrate-binding protein n=1 Tax=Anaerosphaera aminiphila DSM 21120 TaxID=1120995 RepID=A0A1M5T1T8_9FIRM|nr:ABC transporter substrate-binding protein [Anaerosphaera aminiphila]SHH44749.1 branched-chain amino acid transport system substrate-binding protein [Anaerosphaera aminiphila DSM 21120]